MANPQKNKGDKYERELAEYMNDRLFGRLPVPAIYRTPMSGSFSVHDGVGSADLTGTPGLWVEAKRTERFDVRGAIEQAERGSVKNGGVDRPVVINRKNRQTLEDSLCVMRLKDFIEIYEGYLLNLGYKLSSKDGVKNKEGGDSQALLF